ncbi:MAG: hypothetical protein CMK32_02200 [Porticoccaceae bacterium]|nr:hypothetical protein [Porticoccaceae bacterium]
MNALHLEGWWKKPGSAKSEPIQWLDFTIDEACHRRLEEAEETLQKTGDKETFLDVDETSLNLKAPEECGPLSDCRLRVYLDSTMERRCHFHLVGHTLKDHSLVYSNAVLIDQLLD